MTQGGPARATELFVYAIYEQVFLNLSVGRASALTVVFFVLLLALSALQLRAWRGRRGPRRRWSAARCRPIWPYAGRACSRRPRGSSPTRGWSLTSFKTLPGDRRAPDGAAPRAPRPRRVPRGLRRDARRALHGRHRRHGGRPSRRRRSRWRCPRATRSPSCASSGARFAFGTVLACLLVPAQATFVPVFLMFARVRLVDTMTALVLPFAASALGTFLVRQALLSVPDEIIEAARMDGAGEWTIVYRILAPDAPADARVALSRELRLPLQRLLLAAGDDDRRRASARCRSASRSSASRGRACAGTS